MKRESLVGKIALVTGSAREGAHVVLTGYPEARAQALAAELGGTFIGADLHDPVEIRALVTGGIEKCGGLDILVNNVAASEQASICQITPDLFDHQFHIIVRAPLLLVQAALPSLKARRGVVINIGSVNAQAGWPELVTYAAAKAALMTASRN